MSSIERAAASLYLDVTHPAANKGSVVDFLSAVYLIPSSSIATLGDMPNECPDVQKKRLGFAAFGVDAGEIMSSVQIAMIAGLPYTALRDAVPAHPTLLEGLGPLFSLPSAFEWASGRHFPEKS